MQPSFKVLLRCFLRTYLVGANFNTRGMQNVGLVFSMEPGLSSLYRDPGKLRKARKRYLQHYNTHPFWTPLLVGFFLFMERKVSRGMLPEKSVAKVRSTTVYTLSAIGDSLFGGALLVFWALSTTFFLLHDLTWPALIWTAFWFVLLQMFKLYTFYQGVKNGLVFLQRLKQWNLINWGQRIKIVNALLIVALWITILPLPDGRYWFPVTIALCSLAWLVSQLYWAREVVFIVFVLASAILLKVFS